MKKLRRIKLSEATDKESREVINALIDTYNGLRAIPPTMHPLEKGRQIHRASGVLFALHRLLIVWGGSGMGDVDSLLAQYAPDLLEGES